MRLVLLLLAALPLAGGAPQGPQSPPLPLQLAALREMAAAVNAGDAARYARVYAEDAEIVIHGGAHLKGRTAIEQYEIALLAQFPGTRLAFYSIWHKGPVAFARYGVNGPGPGGRMMGHEGLLVYRFHPSGLIAEERRYNDSLTPMSQLGMLGPGPVRGLPSLPDAIDAHTSADSAKEMGNIAAARALLAALDAGNAAAFGALLSPDARIDEMMLPEAMAGAQWFQLWTGAAPGAKTDVTLAIAAGDAVLIEALTTGTLDGAIGRVAARGKPFQIHRAFVFEFSGGRLTRGSSFLNGKELADSEGLRRRAGPHMEPLRHARGNAEARADTWPSRNSRCGSARSRRASPRG